MGENALIGGLQVVEGRLRTVFMPTHAENFVSAATKVVTGPYPDFARLTRKATGDVPSRVAANHTGLSHHTISRMWNGEKVRSENVVKFARAYRIPEAPLLRAGGHDSFVLESKADYDELLVDMPQEVVDEVKGVLCLLRPRELPAGMKAVRAVVDAIIAARDDVSEG